MGARSARHFGTAEAETAARGYEARVFGPQPGELPRDLLCPCNIGERGAPEPRSASPLELPLGRELRPPPPSASGIGARGSHHLGADETTGGARSPGARVIGLRDEGTPRGSPHLFNARKKKCTCRPGLGGCSPPHLEPGRTLPLRAPGCLSRSRHGWGRAPCRPPRHPGDAISE
ncbi:hypothetical protein NDU88_000740 [Pleurodeles waltl]|uniref:Uncharacterized protein n=1 Tax=Pleurodeles waltl TaxID=8319 RepID=A0AAV7U637_PLEWA|nr:hypothetical protein NDU88_000740 [Pleurodeles waltl]